MNFDSRNAADAFPPGEFIKEELDVRGWTQEDLAEIVGRQSSVISGLINGRRAISSDIASDLAAAFGTSAQFWMNLETAYQLFVESHVDESVACRARIYSKAPIKEMIKRGWIEGSKKVDTLEKQVLDFLEISSIDENPELAYAAKSATEVTNSSQFAWVCRARKLARGVPVEKFSQAGFEWALAELKKLMANPEDAQSVPEILAKGGVRFLLIESLPKARIDGACFWLDEFSPVIAISMRYDRLDHFWYLIGHECGHVNNRDAVNGPTILDVDLVGEQALSFENKSDMEKQADRFAEDFLVDQYQLNHFITRTRPLYSKMKIKNFSNRIRVHPAIVLGQLQYRKEVEWSHSREMLVKVREILISSALTDGWGNVPPII
jgi:HTH-type transcriptional regulator / antitoxin HigA